METQPEVACVFWEAQIKFLFPKNDSHHEVPANFGPFVNIFNLLVWRNDFLKALKEKVALMPQVKIKILSEVNVKVLDYYAEDLELEGYVPVEDLTPEEEARLFFSENIQQWMFEFNAPFE
jgi:hypothetical protein